MEAVIEIKNLGKSFGNMQVISDLSFNIKRGRIFGLLGPNGAGKTTTLRMISCLLEPSFGEIRVVGRQVGKDNDEIRRYIGAVTESPGIYDRLTVWDNLSFFASCYGIPKSKKSERIESLLDFFDLLDRRNDLAAKLSKGMKQKLAIARALLPDPEILLLDEATANLDPVSIRKLKDLVRDLAQQGKTIIYCSHTLTEIEELCDEFAIIKGKLIRLTDPEQFRAEWSEYNVVLDVASDHEKAEHVIKDMKEVIKFGEKDGQFQLNISSPETANPVLLKRLVEANIPVKYIHKTSNSLENAYLSLLQSVEEENQ
jgi:ABC-2 type transport system ATP-binding protein